VSQENVEIVRAGYEAFNRGDFDSSTADFHLDVEWHVLADLPDAQVYRGRDEVLRFFKQWRDAFEGFHADIERIVDDGDRIVVLLTVSGSGRGSDAEVRTPTHGQIWTFEGDQIVRVEMVTEEDALKAVRLEEYAMSENLDLVRSIYAGGERGDYFSSVEWADPELELVVTDGPQRGSWKGLAAVGEAWSDFLRNWEDWRVIVEEYRELDEERVLVLVHNSGRGRRSGVEAAQIAAKAANVLHIRGGKVVRFVIYNGWDRALADLGLGE
jgi:uncharacterized protein